MPTIEILTEQGLSVWLENGRLAVSPKTKLTESLRSFIREKKDDLIIELQTQRLESLLSDSPELSEQFEFEIAERISVMIFDGDMSESEAANLARETTTQIWRKIFTE